MALAVSTVGLIGTVATALMVVAVLGFVWMAMRDDRHRAQEFDDDGDAA